MAAEPILELYDVTRRYGTTVAVDRAAFALRPGTVTALLGPSGCGKSTVLRMVAGLEPLDHGTITIDGTTVSTAGRATPPEKRGVGLVFQDNALFPHFDVANNVAFGIRNLSKKERAARVDELLARFHVAHLARAWPHMLSGGEQQRVAIARALARRPALLLLDEPFSGLDGHLRESVRSALVADLRAAGATVLVVTHDAEEAMAIADDLVLMDAGRVLQVGPPDHCYRNPASIAAARLLGEVLVFPAEITRGVAATPIGSIPAPDLPDGLGEAVLRPDAMKIDPTGSDALVQDARFIGHGYRVELELPGQCVAIRVMAQPPPAGSKVGLRADVERARVFAAQT
jgi:iron(III) transport system ATP-binding protein